MPDPKTPIEEAFDRHLKQKDFERALAEMPREPRKMKPGQFDRMIAESKYVQSLRQREGDQPLPTPNDETDVQSLVIEDIRKRRELGITRYGTPLQPFNGRDVLRDLYEELLDAACYVRQAIEERDRAV